MDGADAWQIVGLSIGVALCALAGALPVAAAVAWVLVRTRWRGRAALDLLAQLPLVLPPVVTGWALLLLFGRRGPVGALLERAGVVLAFHWTGAALAAGVMALPLMVRALALALAAVDPEVEAAARTLGASRWAVLRRVTLPLAMPGVAAALLLGFARALGEFGATITFAGNIPGQTRTLPLAIYAALDQPRGEMRVLGLAAASVLLAAFALAASGALSARLRNGAHRRRV